MNHSVTTHQEQAMKTVQIYDKPMCCSTGVCGPQVDPVLPQFAADLEWLKDNGHRVERYNLAQQPQAFIQNSEVHRLLASQGTDCLPLIVVDERIMSGGKYPSRQDLAAWTGSTISLPLVSTASCCGGAADVSPGACCAEDSRAKAEGAAGCGCSDSGCC